MTVLGWQRIIEEDITLDDCENKPAEVVVVDAADVELATLVDDPVYVVAALVVSVTAAVVLAVTAVVAARSLPVT